MTRKQEVPRLRRRRRKRGERKEEVTLLYKERQFYVPLCVTVILYFSL